MHGSSIQRHPRRSINPIHRMGRIYNGAYKKEFELLNINTSEFSTLIQVIPFQFYALLTVLMVPLVALTKLDFGPMAKAEIRVQQTGNLYWPESKPLRKPEDVEGITKNGHAVLIWLPLLVLFVTLFGLLISYGFPFEPVPGNEFRVSLSAAYLFAALSIVVLMIMYKVKKFGEIIDIYTSGMQKMVYVAVTLVLAWSLGKVINEMGTAAFIVEAMKGNVPSFIIPAILFLVGAGMSLHPGRHGDICDYAPNSHSHGCRSRCAFVSLYRSCFVRWYLRRSLFTNFRYDDLIVNRGRSGSYRSRKNAVSICTH